MSDLYVIQPYRRTEGRLEADLPLSCGSEDEAAKRGKAMAHRVAGVAFFRIDTSASGDQWTEIELLSTVGDVPEDDAA
ncbi:hypothetical protein [Brevundimonas sp. TWP2-3-4b1]|uniref:hypothetical protein n=1 Tax=Brevundimonas sp. TWP2-3-4b1 TaxID=2804580 RepID=UPI003CE8AF2B